MQGDFNGDGALDLAMGACNATVAIALNHGNATFDIALSTTNPVICPSSFLTADFNKDGNLDLLSFDSSGGLITILLGTGKGGVIKAAQYAIVKPVDAGVIVRPVAIDDFDGDGRWDFVVGTGHGVSSFLGNGDGTFRPAGLFQLGNTNVSYIATGDFNADGYKDLVTANRPDNTGGVPPITFAPGLGDGTFGPAVFSDAAPQYAGFASNLFVSDFNHDGFSDVAISYDNNGIGIYPGNGTGSFANGKLERCVGCYGSLSDLAIADMNADGILDFVTNGTNGLNNEVDVLLGNADGTFGTTIHFPTAIRGGVLALGDFNADGRMDVAVLPSSFGGSGGQSVVLIGAPGALLLPHVTHDTDLYLDSDVVFDVVIRNDGSSPTTDDITAWVFGLNEVPNLGPEWTCVTFPKCTQSKQVGPGASLSVAPIHQTISYGATTASIIFNVSGGGSPSVSVQAIAAIHPFSRNCWFNIVPLDPISVSASGGAINLSISGGTGSGGGCPITTTVSDPWIDYVPGGGFNAAPNDTGVPRSGSVTFSSTSGWSKVVEIHQLGTGCSFEVRPEYGVISAILNQDQTVYVEVTTGPGCDWSTSSADSWLSPQKISGLSAVRVSVLSNPSTGYRTGTITVAGKVVRVYQFGTADPLGSLPPILSSFPHLAFGADWSTTLELQNTSDQIKRAFVGTFPDGRASNWQYNEFFQPYSKRSYEYTGEGSLLSLSGSSQIYSDPGLSGSLRFRYKPNGQEALVPLETRNASSYTVGFDNTNGFVAGVALANVDWQNPAAVPVIIRGDDGGQLKTGMLTLPANGHTSFVLADQFPETAGKNGTVEFDTPPNGRISVLGIRASAQLQFTTIPVGSSEDPGTGSFAQFVTGNGWTTTIELLNTTLSPQATDLRFFDNNGTALAMPLQLSQGSVALAQTQQTLPPKGRISIVTGGTDTDPVLEGWAQLVAAPGVTGVIRFRYGPTGQETVVPLETRSASSLLLPFDYTGGYATGLALANTSGTPSIIPVVVRDNSGAPLATGTIDLPARGHISFMLADRFPDVARQSGTIQFQTPVHGQISVLGLRVTPQGALVTIPAMSP